MLMSQKTKVFLIDDHPLVREWLANLLNRQSDFQVCGEATNGPEAIKLIALVKPDVAIVDISLDGGWGIVLIKGIRAAYPDVEMVVLTMREESLYAERALRAGARGYVMKREATKKIIPAIRCVLEEETVRERRIPGGDRGAIGGEECRGWIACSITQRPRNGGLPKWFSSRPSCTNILEERHKISVILSSAPLRAPTRWYRVF